jgi:hypothetical protein
MRDDQRQVRALNAQNHRADLLAKLEGSAAADLLVVDQWSPRLVPEYHSARCQRWFRDRFRAQKTSLVLVSTEAAYRLEQRLSYLTFPSGLLDKIEVVDLKHISHEDKPGNSAADSPAVFGLIPVVQSVGAVRGGSGVAKSSGTSMRERVAKLVEPAVVSLFDEGDWQDIEHATNDASEQSDAVLERAAISTAWRAYLLDLAEQHGWLFDEARAHGVNLRGSTNFALYLDRSGLQPHAFVERLFRPADFEDAFGAYGDSEHIETVLQSAFEAWLDERASGGE